MTEKLLRLIAGIVLFPFAMFAFAMLMAAQIISCYMKRNEK